MLRITLDLDDTTIIMIRPDINGQTTWPPLVDAFVDLLKGQGYIINIAAPGDLLSENNAEVMWNRDEVSESKDN